MVAVLALALVLAAACAPEPVPSLIRSSHPAALAGTTWTLVSIGGRTVPAGISASLTFGNASLSGDGPCNGFGGTWTYIAATGALRIDQLVQSLRECIEPDRSALEAAYFDALRGVAGASIDTAGRLVLDGSGPELVLKVGPVVVPAATDVPSGAPSASLDTPSASLDLPPSPDPIVGQPATLAGTSWTIILVAGHAAVPGSAPTVAFSADGITGSTGCNAYSGRYRYDPATARIAIGRGIGGTEMACTPLNGGPGAIMLQEKRLYDTLPAVTDAALDAGGRLLLASPAGLFVLVPRP